MLTPNSHNKGSIYLDRYKLSKGFHAVISPTAQIWFAPRSSRCDIIHKTLRKEGLVVTCGGASDAIWIDHHIIFFFDTDRTYALNTPTYKTSTYIIARSISDLSIDRSIDLYKLCLAWKLSLIYTNSKVTRITPVQIARSIAHIVLLPFFWAPISRSAWIKPHIIRTTQCIQHCFHN